MRSERAFIPVIPCLFIVPPDAGSEAFGDRPMT